MMKRLFNLIFFVLSTLTFVLAQQTAPIGLKVSPNNRFLTTAEGKPFFYLADTAWELFHRTDEKEAEFYLDRRAAQGFTVIQCVILAEENGLRVPNANGDLPLIDLDPTKPNEAYFKYVDKVVDMMAARGLVAGLLPTWGDKWIEVWGDGPVVFTPENARVYGKFLGQRYREKPVIWILGGDRPVKTDLQRSIITNMAEGLKEGDGGRHLMSFHPCGCEQSSQYFHEATWLSFNMSQTGHARNVKNFEYIQKDYARSPVKPCIDGEPAYEAHPNGFKSENGWLGEHDVRRGAYWAVFSGACGHTYGNHAIWQFWKPGRKPKNVPQTTWMDAVDQPGAKQMRHLRTLMESKPFFTRIPDQALLKQGPKEAFRYVAVTSDRTPGEKNATLIMAYFPHQAEVVLDTSVLGKARMRIEWFDPRLGGTHDRGIQDRKDELKIATPDELHPVDWVLILTAIAGEPSVQSGSSVLDVMRKVADWQLATPSEKYHPLDWTQAALYAGLMALDSVDTNTTQYADAVKTVGERNKWGHLPGIYFADDHAVIQSYCELYSKSKDCALIAPSIERFDFILANPVTNPVGDICYKGPMRWWWCDSLFMAPPAWARLYKATGDEKYLNFAINEWKATSAFLYDTEEHLFFRDKKFFPDKRKEANGKKVFWARGNGWVIGGLVRMLQILPENHPDRPFFVEQFKQMCEKVIAIQPADGVWRASLLDPDSFRLQEASGTGFFCYGLAYGLNNKLLDASRARPALEKAFLKLCSFVTPEGKLTHVQPPGVDPKTFDNNTSDVYGVGAFLLAGSEIVKFETPLHISMSR